MNSFASFFSKRQQHFQGKDDAIRGSVECANEHTCGWVEGPLHPLAHSFWEYRITGGGKYSRVEWLQRFPNCSSCNFHKKTYHFSVTVNHRLIPILRNLSLPRMTIRVLLTPKLAVDYLFWRSMEAPTAVQLPSAILSTYPLMISISGRWPIWRCVASFARISGWPHSELDQISVSLKPPAHISSEWFSETSDSLITRHVLDFCEPAFLLTR